MNAINEFDFEPGTYRHYKGGLYVALDIVTHTENPQTGKMEALPDPLVVYRDLNAVVQHVNGRPSIPHRRYARALSEFAGMATLPDGELTKRFTKE